jgi:hypothetical protein
MAAIEMMPSHDLPDLALLMRRLQADGFSEDEARQVAEYCTTRWRAGLFDASPEIVVVLREGEPRRVDKDTAKLVCRTVAEGLEAVRPGSWLSRESDDD